MLRKTGKVLQQPTLHYSSDGLLLYEPSTRALFETREYLKEKIAALIDTDETMLDYLKRANNLLAYPYQMVKFHINEILELEFDVLEYILKSRKIS